VKPGVGVAKDPALRKRVAATIPLDPARRRNTRLLAQLLLIIALSFGTLDLVSLLRVPGYRPPWYGYVFLLAGWLLNRSRYYTAAAGLTLSMFPVVILYGILSGTSADPKATLSYLVLGVVLASILLPVWRTALFAAGCIALILLLPSVAPGAVPGSVLSPLTLLVLGTGLAIGSILHRDGIERERQAELRSSEEQLRLALVAEQTAQAEREALIKDLHAKNAELGRFTYTVSHDLKSPLITVRAYADAMAKDAAGGRLDRLPEDAGRILAATERMRLLLDELLALSRIGRIANAVDDVALGALAEEAVQLVKGRLAQRGVVVSIAPNLPVVRGDRARLREVFQNLIDNAAKFMGAQPEPRIEIGVREAGSEHVYYVRDNGAGIDPRHQERVFGLFDKLDPASGGTGIGLALVKRIVEEVHGGRVWVESEGEGRGSCFCFTLGTTVPAGARAS
jgi:signal transduction histidine kinase